MRYLTPLIVLAFLLPSSINTLVMKDVRVAIQVILVSNGKTKEIYFTRGFTKVTRLKIHAQIYFAHQRFFEKMNIEKITRTL